MPTSVRLEAEQEERLANLAKLTGRTKAYYLRELIEKGLDDLEDYYLAAATMERVRKGEEKVYSAAEVKELLSQEPEDRFKFFLQPDGAVAILPMRKTSELKGVVPRKDQPVTLDEIDDALQKGRTKDESE
jgi:RHH-type rel operon transcriptional repressor/antitoxin RelB